MERKFRYVVWKMPEWNGMEDFKNEMEDNFPYFHTNFMLVLCIVFTKKFIPTSGGDKQYCHGSILLQYLRVIFVDKSRYFVCLLYIAQTVYVLHHCKYIAICSIDVIVDDFDRFDLFFCCFFEIENLPSPKFCFLTSSRKLVFVILFPFQLNFIYIFSVSAYNNSFWR